MHSQEGQARPGSQGRNRGRRSRGAQGRSLCSPARPCSPCLTPEAAVRTEAQRGGQTLVAGTPSATEPELNRGRSSPGSVLSPPARLLQSLTHTANHRALQRPCAHRAGSETWERNPHVGRGDTEAEPRRNHRLRRQKHADSGAQSGPGEAVSARLPS